MSKILKNKKVMLAMIGVSIVCVIFVFTRPKKESTAATQTQIVEKGTLISSISTSGQISNANSGSIGTQASGVVKTIYVKNGDKVLQGQKIAEIELDESGRQNYFQALASYQGAKNSVENAKAALESQKADLYSQWKKFTDLASNSTYTNADGSPNLQNRLLPEFVIAQSNWLASETKSKNQENVLRQSQISLNAAGLSLQQTSSIIIAPITGTVTGLSLQTGTVLTTQTASTGTITSQKVASIKTNAPPTVILNLTEIDIPNVKIGDKATVTLSAFPGVTYTGEVISIDTVGSVSSGVTTYPTIIKFDKEVPEIYSNMSASANIITEVKHNVLILPNKAISTNQGTSTVTIHTSKGDETTVIETGLKTATQTEIISGLNEGDTVVIPSVVSTTRSTSTQTQSPFSAFGAAGGGVRMVR